MGKAGVAGHQVAVGVHRAAPAAGQLLRRLVARITAASAGRRADGRRRGRSPGRGDRRQPVMMPSAEIALVLPVLFDQ